MANDPLKIINSNHWFYLYERWQDEKEYEDFNDYKKSVEETFGVKVIKANQSFTNWTIEYPDKQRFEIGIKKKGRNALVGVYRPA